ncbi:MAG: pitrilysin family protein [Candidatus Moraniibacteriota bacterium]
MLIPDIKFKRKKLPSGLEFLLAPMPKSPTVTAVIIFKVGSRYEQEKYLGISHFLEHMVFKGNDIYKTPHDVAAVVDALGGSYNAFTSKEFTGFHIKVGAEFLDTALQWLGALVTKPLIKQGDAEMERNVIMEEINMYNDTPMMQIGDIFEELLYSGANLGRSIIGNKRTLRNIKSTALSDHFKNNYFPENAILVLAGNLGNLNSLQKKISPSGYFKFSSRRKNIIDRTTQKVKKSNKKVKIVYKKTDQTHLILGAKTFSYFDKRRYPLAVISTIMGGSMSSWAFTEIREKRGLAYYVRSATELHNDTGSYSINAGLNNDKLELAIKEIAKLYKRIRTKLVTQRELKRAKDHLIGGTLLERETSSDIAFILGSDMAARGSVTPLSKEMKLIKKISREEIKRIAEDFFAPEKLRLAMIGPWRGKDECKFIDLLR